MPSITSFVYAYACSPLTVLCQGSTAWSARDSPPDFSFSLAFKCESAFTTRLRPLRPSRHPTCFSASPTFHFPSRSSASSHSRCVYVRLATSLGFLAVGDAARDGKNVVQSLVRIVRALAPSPPSSHANSSIEFSGVSTPRPHRFGSSACVRQVPLATSALSSGTTSNSIGAVKGNLDMFRHCCLLPQHSA